MRTYSRRFRSPQRFVILRTELERLAEKKWLLTNDIHSFAELRLKNNPSGDEAMVVRFSWLTDAGGNNLRGYSETVLLPFAPFGEYLADSGAAGKEWRVLSLKEDRAPKIEFHSYRNLRAVADNPLLRHKLGCFLSRNLRWVDYERFVVTDDFIPYSFAFTGYTPCGRGICGGIILHGQENLQKAYYGLHT